MTAPPGLLLPEIEHQEITSVTLLSPVLHELELRGIRTIMRMSRRQPPHLRSTGSSHQPNDAPRKANDPCADSPGGEEGGHYPANLSTLHDCITGRHTGEEGGEYDGHRRHPASRRGPKGASAPSRRFHPDTETTKHRITTS